MVSSPIYVTQPSLPPLSEFMPYLEKIWESKILTNGGAFHCELEQALCNYLGVKHLALFNNGTIALIAALKALDISGEVITTPYSFVATTHALMWNNIQPVFVDIDPATLNLDPSKIEAAITAKTTAILPVHCYGRPCDVEAIEAIAQKHQLKVIYDGAHAFGVKHAEQSIFNFGDLSVLSFHATKVFNTFEGGAIVCHDADMKQKIDHLKNFGFVDETTVVSVGINGKMAEINAAFGLLQLTHIDRSIAKRKAIDALYRQYFTSVPGIKCFEMDYFSNYGYFPILVKSEYPLTRDALYLKLREKGFMVRRYFYPLISDYTTYSKMPSSATSNLPVATNVAQVILCLPIYPDLVRDVQLKMIEYILEWGMIQKSHSSLDETACNQSLLCD